MLEAPAGGMDRRNRILRSNWPWNQLVGMRHARRLQLAGARGERMSGSVPDS
jgi:hypothetical protein